MTTAILAGAGLLLGSSGGVALAGWMTRSSGTGSVTTASLTLSGEATASGLLAPGTSSAVQLTLRNSSPEPVTVVSLNGGKARIARTGSGPCDPSSVTFVARDDLSVPIPARGTATVTGSLSLSATAGNGCQRATFTVPVTARAQRP